MPRQGIGQTLAVPPEAPGGRSDEELMLAYQKGEEGAFRLLYKRYGARVFNYLVFMTGSKNLAEDLAQKSWLRLHQARMRYQADSRFAAWLFTIVANQGRDNWRSEKRERLTLTADGRVPETQVIPKELDETQERLHRALTALPEQYREVILLHRYFELDMHEIAQELKTTEGAIKQRAFRGYSLLREMLKEKVL